jgi:hypothetical protein
MALRWGSTGRFSQLLVVMPRDLNARSYLAEWVQNPGHTVRVLGDFNAWSYVDDCSHTWQNESRIQVRIHRQVQPAAGHHSGPGWMAF